MTDRTLDAAGRSPVRAAALIVGVVFLIVGLAGFIPGVTTDYSALGGAGPDSRAQLVGLFQVSVLHNIVHLLFGVVGVLMSRTAANARLFLVGGGVVYLVLWIYGLAVGPTSTANFVPLNVADDWLHFVLGIGMIGLGVVLTRGRGVVSGSRAAT